MSTVVHISCLQSIFSGFVPEALLWFKRYSLNTERQLSVVKWYLLILLRVSLMWGYFSLNVSFMSFFKSDGFTYSITVV